MNVLLKLTSISLKNTLTGDNTKKSKGKLAAFAFLFIYMFGILSFFMYYLAKQFQGTGLESVVVVYGFLICTLLTFILCISSISNIVFKSKDNDLLFSMPINKNLILISKLLSILITCYIYELVCVLPCLIVYFIFTPITFSAIFISIICFLFFPLIIICVSLLISAITSFLLNKLKYKNLFTTLFLFVFFGGFMFLYLGVDFEKIATDATFQNNILSLQNFFPNIKWAFDSITQANYLSLLWLVLVSLAAFGLTYWFFKSVYFIICGKQNSGGNIKYSVSYKGNSQFWGLVKKEIKRFFSSPIQMFNQGFGLLMLVGGTIYLCITQNDILTLLAGFPDAIFAIPFLLSAVVGTCNTACISISLEKKYYSYSKCFPIESKNIINSKIFANILICLPFIILSSILISIFYYVNIFGLLLNFILPILFISFVAIFGIWINILLPKTDALNDTIIVKQSGSSFFGVMIPMFFPILYCVLYLYLLSSFMPLIWGVFTFVVLLVIISLAIYYYLIKNSNKLLKNIN